MKGHEPVLQLAKQFNCRQNSNPDATPLPLCDGDSIADELHLVFESPAWASVRQKCAQLFTPATDSTRSFFGQDAQMQIFRFILDCLDVCEVWSEFSGTRNQIVDWPKHVIIFFF